MIGQPEYFLNRKDETWVEMLGRVKHASLLHQSINYVAKRFCGIVQQARKILTSFCDDKIKVS
jgi:hypothetical protein